MGSQGKAAITPSAFFPAIFTNSSDTVRSQPKKGWVMPISRIVLRTIAPSTASPQCTTASGFAFFTRSTSRRKSFCPTL